MVTLPEVLVAGIAAIAVPSLAYVGVRAALANIRKMEAEVPRPATDADDRLARLEHEVAELQERVDFAERLLARGSDPGRLAGERTVA
jgi:hypothetical protein